MYNGTVHQLFTDSVRREAVYNILIEIWTPRKLTALIKMFLNKTYSRVRIGNNLSESFLFRMV
jgi:hypothetical protein